MVIILFCKGDIVIRKQFTIPESFNAGGPLGGLKVTLNNVIWIDPIGSAKVMQINKTV